MLVAIVLSARWVVRRLAVPPTLGPRLEMGFVAVALLLTAEIIGARLMRGLTIPDYLAGLTRPSGFVFLAMVSAFGLMPALVGRGRRGLIGGTHGDR